MISHPTILDSCSMVATITTHLNSFRVYWSWAKKAKFECQGLVNMNSRGVFFFAHQNCATWRMSVVDIQHVSISHSSQLKLSKFPLIVKVIYCQPQIAEVHMNLSWAASGALLNSCTFHHSPKQITSIQWEHWESMTYVLVRIQGEMVFYWDGVNPIYKYSCFID